MVDRGSGEAVDSALSYSVLENDADIYTGPSGEFGSGRVNYARGAAGGGKSGRLSQALRAAAPHATLVTVYVAFLLLGGGLFYLLEARAGALEDTFKGYEYTEYEIIKDRLEEMAPDHLNLTQAEMETMGNWSILWKALDAMAEGPYGFDFDFRGPDYRWKRVTEELSFSRSVMFCATTIATIGYGDSIPQTPVGKLLIVIVSLLGIPLTLIVYADIGKLLANGVSLLVDRWRSRGGAPKRQTDPDVPAILVLVILVVYVLLASAAVLLVEGWYYQDALYFTFTTLTTIGFGDIVPISHHDHVPSFIFLLLLFMLSFSVLAMCIVVLLPKAMALIHKVAGKAGF